MEDYQKFKRGLQEAFGEAAEDFSDDLVSKLAILYQSGFDSGEERGFQTINRAIQQQLQGLPLNRVVADYHQLDVQGQPSIKIRLLPEVQAHLEAVIQGKPPVTLDSPKGLGVRNSPELRNSFQGALSRAMTEVIATWPEESPGNVVLPDPEG